MTVFKLCTAIENKTGLIVCLVGETYWRGSRPLKRKFTERDKAKKYLNDFIDKYYKLYKIED